MSIGQTCGVQTTGAWGFASDENDWTWDAVGLGIMERLHGVSEPDRAGACGPAERRREETLMGPGEVLKQPGVAMFLLKLGCTLNMETIRHVKTLGCRTGLLAAKCSLESREIFMFCSHRVSPRAPRRAAGRMPCLDQDLLDLFRVAS